MTLAEDLVEKYSAGLPKQVGNYPVRIELTRAINEAIERAAQEAEREMVDAEDTKDVTDRAYNQACVHVALAIRKLKG